MPTLKTYDLFISHAWFYSKGYNSLVDLLNDTNNLSWRNYSVPKHDPVIDPNSYAGKKKLEEALIKQISPVNCILVISGMYVAYRYWIQKEIDIALNYFNKPKPIIGLVPWGQVKTPKEVQDVAIAMVGWNTNSIVSAIRNYSL